MIRGNQGWANQDILLPPEVTAKDEEIVMDEAVRLARQAFDAEHPENFADVYRILGTPLKPTGA